MTYQQRISGFQEADFCKRESYSYSCGYLGAIVADLLRHVPEHVREGVLRELEEGTNKMLTK